MAVDHAAACSSRILRAEKMASPIGGLAGGRRVVPPSLRLEGADILPRLRESMADKTSHRRGSQWPSDEWARPVPGRVLSPAPTPEEDDRTISPEGSARVRHPNL